MDKKSKSIIAAAVLIAALAALIVAAAIIYPKLRDKQAKADVESATEQELEAVPSFYDAEGEHVDLREYLGKKPIIINCWATWCPPCKAEMPDFQRAYDSYGDEIEFFFVNVSWSKDSREDAESFLKENGYEFPIYFDVDGELTEEYNIQGIPYTIIINKDGNLLYNAAGMMTEDQISAWIDKLLSD